MHVLAVPVALVAALVSNGGDMSGQEQPGTAMVPLHVVPGQPEPPVLRARDIHYEMALDDEPAAGRPVPADLVPVLPGQARPIIPEHLQTWAGVQLAARLHAGRQWHRARYHGVRSGRYLLLGAVWSVAGVVRLIGRQIRWWWLLEQHQLRSQAAADGDSREWAKLHKEAKETRKVRGYILLAETLGVIVACVLAVRYLPWWGCAAAAAVLVPLAAHHGRPKDKPIITPAVVVPRFRRLSADVVLRAYYAAGLGHPEKPDQQVTFGSTMSRDGEGTRVLIDLPYGRGLKDAVNAKDSIASGLDVTESQVFLHRDPTSARRHTLWVADRDPLAVPVGRTPLLACRQTDIWKPAPIGLDERGQLVRVPLMWNSLLVGALPRQGKTFAARSLALYCALDPYVQMEVFDAAGKPDWRKFALVAHSCAFGLTPTKDGLPPQILLGTLEDLKDEVNDRYHRLSALADKNPAACPEGKLTRQLARDPQWRMPVRVLFLDEVQEYFDLGDVSKEIAKLLVFLIKVAPGAGVSVVAATQKPSGIGTGFVNTQWMSFRDQFGLRFSLRTSSRDVSEMVLGAGAYGEGLDSSKLLPEYKGVGILRHATDKSPTTRTFLADGADAEKVLVAARAIRVRAGTLSGMALGQQAAPAEVPVLADVLDVMGDAPGMHWVTLAALLAQRFPERHADCTAESVSAQCRAAGVPSVDVKQLGRSAMGCRREHIDAALRP